MWVRVHHHEPTEPRPWEWLPRSHAMVEAQGDYGFRASAMIQGAQGPQVDPGLYASLDAARESADALVLRHDPHECGPRCLGWKRSGERAPRPRVASQAPEG